MTEERVEHEIHVRLSDGDAGGSKQNSRQFVECIHNFICAYLIV